MLSFYLGNNFNTTEDDIAQMAVRLAPAAAQLNMTEGDVLGLATALSEAKITAEGGGTAMTQVLTNINNQMVAFRTGAENNLPRIAEIAGMSAEEFADVLFVRAPNKDFPGKEVNDGHRQHIAQDAHDIGFQHRKVHSQSDGNGAPQFDQRHHGHQKNQQIFCKHLFHLR